MESATLPGAELVAKGVEDLARDRVTIEALLVSIGAPRLRLLYPGLTATLPDAELRLYALLRATHGDGAHSRYNALLRRLVSFQRATCVK
jgi:hypothetical protein